MPSIAIRRRQRPLCSPTNVDLAGMIARGHRSLSCRHALAQAARRDARPERLHRRWPEPGRHAILPHQPQEMPHGRPLWPQVDRVNGCLDPGLDRRGKSTRTPGLARRVRQHRRRDRVLAKSAYERIDARHAQTEACSGSLSRRPPYSRGLGNGPYHGFPLQRSGPICLGSSVHGWPPRRMHLGHPYSHPFCIAIQGTLIARFRGILSRIRGIRKCLKTSALPDRDERLATKRPPCARFCTPNSPPSSPAPTSAKPASPNSPASRPRQVNNWARGRAAAPTWAAILAVLLQDHSPEALTISVEEALRALSATEAALR